MIWKLGSSLIYCFSFAKIVLHSITLFHIIQKPRQFWSIGLFRIKLVRQFVTISLFVGALGGNADQVWSSLILYLQLPRLMMSSHSKYLAHTFQAVEKKFQIQTNRIKLDLGREGEIDPPPPPWSRCSVLQQHIMPCATGLTADKVTE